MASSQDRLRGRLIRHAIKEAAEDETFESPFRALCDAGIDAAQSSEHGLSTSPYAIGTTVQGAFCEAGSAVWCGGRVVSNDACSVTVRFDKDGVEETHTLPNDRAELGFLRPHAPAPSERSLARGPKTAQSKRREISSEPPTSENDRVSLHSARSATCPTLDMNRNEPPISNDDRGSRLRTSAVIGAHGKPASRAQQARTDWRLKNADSIIIPEVCIASFCMQRKRA